MRNLILAAVLLLPLHAEMFDLQFERLATALAGLATPDRSVVDDAVALIRKGENNLALAKLSALNKQSPKNSSLRILTAYTLLRAGDAVGALDNAKQAEASPDGEPYKCWFLAKVAFLTGDTPTCKREIIHAKTHMKNDSAIMADLKSMEKSLPKK